MTQCLSFVGVLKFSPLKMCPKCPSHLEHVISILVIPFEVSGVCFTAPGIASKKAGQPHPESNLVVDLYSGVLHPAQ